MSTEHAVKSSYNLARKICPFCADGAPIQYELIWCSTDPVLHECMDDDGESYSESCEAFQTASDLPDWELTNK